MESTPPPSHNGRINIVCGVACCCRDTLLGVHLLQRAEPAARPREPDSTEIEDSRAGCRSSLPATVAQCAIRDVMDLTVEWARLIADSITSDGFRGALWKIGDHQTRRRGRQRPRFPGAVLLLHSDGQQFFSEVVSFSSQILNTPARRPTLQRTAWAMWVVVLKERRRISPSC